MEIQRCFETLEIPKDSSIEDVHQAYRDLVNIWHPDRVGDNPRLKKKAEEKLKDINLAYEDLNSFLSSRPKIPPTVPKTPREHPTTEVFQSADRAKTETKNAPKLNEKTPLKGSFFSSVWSFLSEALVALNTAQGSSNESMRTRTTPFEPMTGGAEEKQRQGHGEGERHGRRRKRERPTVLNRFWSLIENA